MPGFRRRCQDAAVGGRVKLVCSRVPREAGNHMERTRITKSTSEIEDLDGDENLCLAPYVSRSCLYSWGFFPLNEFLYPWYLVSEWLCPRAMKIDVNESSRHYKCFSAIGILICADSNQGSRYFEC